MKTERLELAPMTAEEVFSLAESCGDAELAEAYREMGDGVLKYPDQALWYTAWRIVLNKTGETVGDLCFKGLPDSGRPEIGYGILPEWEGRGYATEAVRAACSWTLSQPGVVSVEAKTEPENAASQRVLKKAGFYPLGRNGEEGPCFRLEKEERK